MHQIPAESLWRAKSLQKSTIIDKLLSDEEVTLMIPSCIIGKGFKSYTVVEQLPRALNWFILPRQVMPKS